MSRGGGDDVDIEVMDMSFFNEADILKRVLSNLASEESKSAAMTSPKGSFATSVMSPSSAAVAAAAAAAAAAAIAGDSKGARRYSSDVQFDDADLDLI